MARQTVAEKRAAAAASAEEARRFEAGRKAKERIERIAGYRDADELKQWHWEGMSQIDILMAQTIYNLRKAQAEAESRMRGIADRASRAAESISLMERPWDSRIDARDVNDAMAKWEVLMEQATNLCHAGGYYSRSINPVNTVFAMECIQARRLSIECVKLAERPGDDFVFAVNVDGVNEATGFTTASDAWVKAGELLKALADQAMTTVVNG